MRAEDDATMESVDQGNSEKSAEIEKRVEGMETADSGKPNSTEAGDVLMSESAGDSTASALKEKPGDRLEDSFTFPISFQ